MGSPDDLTLSCHTQVPSGTAATTTVSKTSPPFEGNQLERVCKVEEYLRGLEDERRKIEAFKRELPLCMQLLDDAIEASKEQQAENPPSPTISRPCQLSPSNRSEANVESSSGRPVLEEFIPLKRRWERQQREERGEGESNQPAKRPVQEAKPAWMAEAQLWTHQSEPLDHHQEKDSPPGRHGQSEQEQSSVTSSRLLLSSKQRPGGAFLPFIRERQLTVPLVSRSTGGAGNGADLRLSSADRASSPNGHTFGAADSEVGSIDVSLRTQDQGLNPLGCKEMGLRSNGMSGAGSTSVGGSQSQRKARRCWSPELHRRFVSALQQLGGAQVATPKQIRELMKVDGLTNDEVKSHLQKYRLHTRRPSPSQTATAQAPQLVVLGGIWVPPEYAAASSQPSSGQQSHYCQPSLPHDYSSRPSGGQLQMHGAPFFEQQQAASQSQTSPQRPLQAVTSQLSGAARRSSHGNIYQDDSGGEEGNRTAPVGEEGNQRMRERMQMLIKHNPPGTRGKAVTGTWRMKALPTTSEIIKVQY